MWGNIKIAIIMVKHLNTNDNLWDVLVNNILTFKFHNRSIHLNIKAYIIGFTEPNFYILYFVRL